MLMKFIHLELRNHGAIGKKAIALLIKNGFTAWTDSSKLDDFLKNSRLTRINGIGPKIQSVIKESIKNIKAFDKNNLLF